MEKERKLTLKEIKKAAEERLKKYNSELHKEDRHKGKVRELDR